MHKKHKVMIRVKPLELPEGEQIYIVGSHELLGSWQPGKVPLIPDPEGSGYWQRDFHFRKNAEIEFKFTRGNWETEAADANGHVLSNYHLLVSGDTTLEFEIPAWSDLARDKARETAPGRITGAVQYHRNVSAPGLRPRDLIVWLPPGYEDSPQQRYPVIYMHDGQNVFDPVTSYTGVDWQADETATRLIREGKMREVLIVGIYNTQDRLEEYSASPLGRKYRQFIIRTVKPLIDATYRTLPDRENTATIGSSMGGLVSFLLVWFHAETFSMAGCLSPSFIFRKNQAIKRIKKSKPPRQKIRIYMDVGGIGGERLLHRGCKKVLRILRNKGFKIGKEVFFSYYRRARHSETDWAKRLEKHFLFMFGLK